MQEWVIRFKRTGPEVLVNKSSSAVRGSRAGRTMWLHEQFGMSATPDIESAQNRKDRST